jgi:NAD+ synthase
MDDIKFDAAAAQKILVQFVQDQVWKNGFKRAVIGLSGGIDSALSCFLAVKALGAENVLGIRMPYKTSSASSLEDAQKVIDATGISSLTIPITPMVDPLIEQYPEMTPLRKGNIMARMRMIVLYDQSAAFNGLVVGTGNKTEILLGYSTLYGDAACAFDPIGDLYKAQVRELSRFMGVPESIITKAPSADLWQGQTDEGELGFTYEEVDRLFVHLIEKEMTPAACVSAGFDEAMVKAVLKRVHASHFKRTMPPVARVSNRMVDELDFANWEM